MTNTIDPHPHVHDEPRLRDIPLTWRTLPSMPALALIRLYQIGVSPILPGETCRFQPTCSHYSYQAILKYGALKGSLLSIWRILRCQPFNPGGFDPVP